MHQIADRFPHAVATPTESESVVISGQAGMSRPLWTPIRHLELVIDPEASRKVHGEIAARLRNEGIRVSFTAGREPQSLPASVELLLRLERMLTRASDLGDRCAFEALASPSGSSDGPADLTIDLTGSAAASGRTLRVLYDGAAGDCALMGALFAGRMPVIELEDGRSGELIARGAPCADNAGSIHGALDAVLARLATLVIATASGSGTVAESMAPPPRPVRFRELAAFQTKTLAHAAVRKLYHLCCYAPHWRVCWRFVDDEGVWGTGSLDGTSWRPIPDPGDHFYADPFPFTCPGQTWVFVEDLDHRRNKGVIAAIPFDEQGPSGPARPVLEEPWHLSYPFVFERDGQVWMIPESSANRTVTLYRAQRFPDRWVPEATLLSDVAASDATIVERMGRLWMFAATRDGAGSWSDTLSIFSAENLLGPWTAHPRNPILIDQSSARPAGRLVRRGEALWRPVQDCTAGYGTGIGLVEVLRLDPENYAQRLHTIIRPPTGWPGRRLHTLNRAGRLECIDGAAHSPRNRLLARYLQTWSGRREIGS